VSSDNLVLETPRLLLRLPRLDDFEVYALHMGDEESAHFLGGAQHRAVAWRGFLQIAGAWQLQGFSMFSVIEKASGDWIGRVGPWMPEGWPGTEVGWSILRSRWGKGFATEAAIASIEWAFEHLGWTEVIHSIDVANAPSQAVARKLGACNRGPGRLPPPYETVDVEIWGQTREEWYR
jgi:RimJ/RimL family protein N-acetyltransferase